MTAWGRYPQPCSGDSLNRPKTLLLNCLIEGELTVRPRGTAAVGQEGSSPTRLDGTLYVLLIPGLVGRPIYG